jgi:hypothetical protein
MSTENVGGFQQVIDALREPFDPALLNWFVGDMNFNPQDVRKLPAGFCMMGQALCSIDSRWIQERLDTVLGPLNWRNEIQKAPDGSIIQGIAILIDGEYHIKWDGVGAHDKWGFTSSFSRAAAMWGIGRYLYLLGVSWQPVVFDGKKWSLVSRPALPAFAMPYGWEAEQGDAVALLPDLLEEGMEEVDPNEPRYEDIVEGEEQGSSNPLPLAQHKGNPKKEGKVKEDLVLRAKAYKVPQGTIMAGSTLGEVLKDPVLGPQIIGYLAGKTTSRAGKFYAPATEEEHKMMNAAEFLYTSVVLAGVV